MPSPDKAAVRVPAKRTNGLVVQELAGETLVYDLERHKAHCLGSSLAAIWRACNGRATRSQLARRIAAQAGAPIDEDIVGVALHRLQKARLLDGTAPMTPAPRSSRRELLRRMAVLGGFALFSVTAPRAAQAASCQANCNTTPQGAGGKNCSRLPCCEPQFAGLFCKQQGAATFCQCS